MPRLALLFDLDGTLIDSIGLLVAWSIGPVLMMLIASLRPPREIFDAGALAHAYPGRSHPSVGVRAASPGLEQVANACGAVRAGIHGSAQSGLGQRGLFLGRDGRAGGVVGIGDDQARDFSATARSEFHAGL